ncbi:MAG: BtrH N-terminal domain-containing protein [Solirubrobacterales bacterium]
MAGTPTRVPGYVHTPGNHCGSTALRNLLAFHTLELSEEMAFGLGAGPCFYYVVREDSSPTRFTNGRTARLEEQFLELSGLPLELERFEGRAESWAAAKGRVDSGRPALLLTDLYYLDHYGSSAHFPGHAVVLAGYDEEAAFLSDTDFEELQRTTLGHLADARHAQHPVYPLAGDMVSVAPSVKLADPTSSLPAAIEAAVRRMLDPPLGEYEGIPALRRLVEEIGQWPEAASDWQWCARFSYQAIERRGTGGGNFRLMYSRFLAEAGHATGAELAAAASSAWTRLSVELRHASEEDRPRRDRWTAVEKTAGEVLRAEEALWSELSV